MASMVAADDKRVSFTIHLGGVAQPFEEIMLYQSEAIFRVSNELTDKEIENSLAINKQIYELFKKSKNTEEAFTNISQYWEHLSSQLTEEEKQKYNITPTGKLSMIQTFSSPWFYTLFHIDPKKYLKKIKTPVLAISGEKDLQVKGIETFINMQRYLKKNPKNEFVPMPGLNHLLQPCTTGSPDEYGNIETTIAPEVLDIIVTWCREIAL